MVLRFDKKTLVHLALTCFFSYCGYHYISGQQGLYAQLVGSYQAELLQAELTQVKAERIALEHRVSLLRTEHLDPDLLDEQARRYLGYADSDEWIIFTQ